MDFGVHGFEKGAKGMIKKIGDFTILMFAILFLLTTVQLGFAASLPESTQKILKKLKVDTSIMKGLDKELNIPKEWIEGAKKEGKVKVRGTPARPKEINSIIAPFRERYPFIEVDFFGANRQGRTVKTLMAYKSGRFLADAVFSVGAFVTEFERAGGLVDLRPLPAFGSVPKGLKSPTGTWTGISKLYWCISYNTRMVKQEDLPKVWEDLLTSPLWRNGNFALGNRPNLWLGSLWMTKGEKWAKKYMTRLFSEVKPQLRKEGMSALVQLIAAGEFHAAAPSNYRRTYQMVLEGAPVGYFCPEPAPASTEEAVLLKGSPNSNAAKVFLNWLLSKEGQISRYAGGLWGPVHKDLSRKEFLPFADQILGKKLAFRDPARIDEVMPPLFEYWNALWAKGGGRPRR